MRFDYVKVELDDPKLLWMPRPLIPVRLTSKSRHTTALALLDSGADKSLFSIDYAKELGLDTEIGRAESFGGIAGEEVIAFFHPVELQIMGSDESLKLEVGFTDSPGVSAILGQADFFKHYTISFERAKEKIEIKSITQK
jgi:hypothetical protein